jgi:molecular chaperone GrpE
VKHDIHKKTKEESAEAAAVPPDAPAEAEDRAPQSAEEGEARLAEGPGAAAQNVESQAPVDPAVDYKDRWLRAEAELQTYRRRARREIEDARRSAEESVLLELVSWLDDLERAAQAANESGASPSWSEGVSLVIQKGRESLERLGVTQVDPLEQPFDPHFHEAILEIDPPPGAAPGSVVQVIHKGYRRGTRALRPARVVVARGEAGGH